MYDCIRPLIQANVVESGAALRRMISQGGVKINNEVVKKLDAEVKEGDVLKVGKKHFVKVNFV